MTKPLIVIGLDGADLELINRWKEDLPFFKRILEGGVYGKLKSTTPPITMPAWTSMFTGKNPEKLGIADFHIIDKHSLKLNLPFYEELSANNLWNFMRNEKVVVWNVPGSSPSLNENVRFIGSWVPTDDGEMFIAPESFKKWVTKRVPDIRQLIPVHRNVKKSKDNHNLIFELERKQAEILKELFTSLSPSLLINVFRSTDFVMHHGRSDKKMKKAYLEAESILHNLGLDLNEVNLMLVSDHGSKKMHRKFNINTWLNKRGYLKLKENKRKTTIILNNILFRFGVLLSSLGLKDLLLRIKKKTAGKNTSTVATFMDKIQLNGTKVFSFFHVGNKYCSIYLLDKNIEEKLTYDLKKLKDPKNNKNVVEKIYRKEYFYNDAPENFPDLLVKLKEGYYSSSEIMPMTFFDNESFEHDEDGIVMAIGPDFKSGCKVDNPNIVDIAPTILHMLGYPVDKEMDGNVLKGLFREDSEPYEREIKYTEHSKEIAKGRLYEKENEEDVKERLKALGYLD